MRVSSDQSNGKKWFQSERKNLFGTKIVIEFVQGSYLGTSVLRLANSDPVSGTQSRNT